MAMMQTTETLTIDAQAAGVATTRHQFPGAGLVRKAGVGVATAMLALGLFVGAGGASAAPLAAPVVGPAPVVQAGAASASYYYSPTIAVPSAVASGDAIAIGGAGFDAYDAVSVYLVDGYGNVLSSGTAYTDYYGAISGVLYAPYEAPGAYTVVAIDGYGTVVTVGLWITY